MTEITQRSEYRTKDHTVVLRASAVSQHVMGLVIDPTDHTRGIVRCIVDRQGSPSDPTGWMDRSVLRLAHLRDETWEVGSEIKIAGLEELVADSIPSHLSFIGCEDPDLYQDSKGMLHLFFTVPFAEPTWTEAIIHLGHASGPDLEHLTMREFALASEGTMGFKETCLGPVRADGTRFSLVESLENDGSWFSSASLAIVPPDFSSPWKFQGYALDPKTMRTRFASFFSSEVAEEINYRWCSRHLSPCRLLPHEFVDPGNGLMVGILNGRGEDISIGLFDRFRIGLFLFDPATGEIPWVDPLPFIDDPKVESVIFSSDFHWLAGSATATLYAHHDDSHIVAYEITRAEILAALPDDFC